MAIKNKRKLFLSPNKYQDRILLPFYIACLIAMLCVGALVLIDHSPDDARRSFDTLLDSQYTRQKIIKVVFGLLICVIFVTFVYWAYTLANRTVGAYERVIRELDEIILGQKSGPVHTRPKDDMFAGLLFRINILTEKRKSKRDQMIAELIHKRLQVKSLDPEDYFHQNRAE